MNMQSRWDVYEYLKKYGLPDHLLPRVQQLEPIFPEIEREEIEEGIEEYKAARWLKKGA
jgi:hypothetical protein